MDACPSLLASLTRIQITSSEIPAQLSEDGTVSFFDPHVAFEKTDVDRVLAQAQEQATRLATLEREVARSKEYLIKVTPFFIHPRVVCTELLMSKHLGYEGQGRGVLGCYGRRSRGSVGTGACLGGRHWLPLVAALGSGQNVSVCC